jgi:hypothetical protein
VTMELMQMMMLKASGEPPGPANLETLPSER